MFFTVVEGSTVGGVTHRTQDHDPIGAKLKKTEHQHHKIKTKNLRCDTNLGMNSKLMNGTP